MDKKDLFVVTSAFPFVPADLNLAHFSSTYVPADVAYRYLKSFKYNVIQVNATDVHSFFASKDGVSIDNKYVEYYNNFYIELYKKLNINYDNYFMTSDIEHIKITQDAIRNLKEEQQLLEKKSYTYICKKCNGFIPYNKVKLNEIEECPYCGGKEYEEFLSMHWWLRLSDKKKELKKIISELDLQFEVKNFLLSQIDLLEDWDFTRNNQFGIQFPYDNNLTVYLWFESLIGYYSLIKKFIKGDTNIHFIHFFGKNIMYYHGLVWPIILKYALNLSASFKLSARGFWNEEESQNEMLDVSKVIEKYDPDYLRFYIIYKVTDNIKDFKMTVDDFIDVINRVLISKIINLNYRVFCILKRKNTVPINEGNINYFSEYIQQIHDKLNKNEINGILKIIIDVINIYNKKISKPENRNIDNNDNAIELAQLSAFIYIALKPITTNLVEKINIFNDFNIETFEDIVNVQGKELKKEINKIDFLE